MNHTVYQQYIFVYYHLKSLLREWTKIKPIFEAKLPSKHCMSPYTKHLLSLSLSRRSKRIDAANLDLRRVLNHVFVFCKISSIDPLYKPNMGVSLYKFASGIAEEITLLQEKFETETLAFKHFPYEFQSRLVDLLPPRDCIAFKLAGKTAAKHVEHRSFSRFLFVVRNSINYEELNSHGIESPKFVIASTRCFLKSDNYYVEEGLHINMDSTEKFDRAVKIISGTFLGMEIHGPYTWKHAIQLMNISKEIMHVLLGDGMSLKAENFDDFFEAVVNWLNNQKNARTLQKRNTKLQSGKKQRNKDGSEPPGVANKKLSDLKDMDSLLNWTSTDKPRFVANGQSRRMASLGPRPLHASQSATNALSITDAAALETSVKRISLRDSADMEHRTLKSRENGPTVSSRAHYQNMKSLQHLVDGFSTANSSNRNSFIDMDLPPPARIMPYSGIKPQNNGIVRPAAFRTLNQQATKENSRSIGNLVASSTSSSSSASSVSRNGHRFFPLASSHSVSRLGLFSNATSTSSTLAPPSANDENDYDTVPDTYDRPCTNSTSKPANDPTTDNYDLIYSFQHPQNENLHHRRVQSGASNGSSNHYHMPAQNSSLTSSNSSSTTSGLPHSPPYSLKKSGSRHSGLHITPSPSDSGIVDFEFQNILRDKENELTNVRTTMEQNEEVLVRVYQDKERQYRDQLADLRAKLQASQQGEAALRHQLRMSDEKRVKMQNDIDALTEDKSNLQRKCQTIERELYGIQGRFEDFVRDSKAAKCDNCARRISGNSIYENSMALAGGHGSGKAPVPTPRQSKEASVNSERGNDDLRGQVDDLRSEISTLRDQLTSQMRDFVDQRRMGNREILC